MKLKEICKAAEYFILGEEQCWFDHFVVIQSRNKYKAKFSLFGASGMKDICMQSICARYVPIVHTTDPKYNKFDQYDIVEIFHTRKKYFEYQTKEIEKADREENGNGMILFLVETYVKSMTSGYESYDTKTYYFDDETGKWYKELFDWPSSLYSNSHSITIATSSETYIEEDGEEYYKPLIGRSALEKNYQDSFLGSNLARMFSEIDFQIHELGKL